MSMQPAGTGTSRRSAGRRPDLDSVYTINPDGSRNFLHPADVRGRWQRRKDLVFALLLAVYLGAAPPTSSAPRSPTRTSTWSSSC